MKSDMIAASVTFAIFIGLVVVAFSGFQRTGAAAARTGRRGHVEERRPAAQRPRASRPLRRDRQADLLSADATVTFATERRLAGVDEVFAALDRDLVGLVPVKKKVQEVAALLLVDRARQSSACRRPGPTCICALPARPGPGRPPWPVRCLAAYRASSTDRSRTANR